jgi:hypothetical protein
MRLLSGLGPSVPDPDRRGDVDSKLKILLQEEMR